MICKAVESNLGICIEFCLVQTINLDSWQIDFTKFKQFKLNFILERKIDINFIKRDAKMINLPNLCFINF